ncbi:MULTISPECIES: DUF922 domain-containing protein [Burkholderiaceae]|uniref:DUF922 domain-containing protein n=1 Tax=Caballeronia zhejiangensis TaxID=871203 RepID=A0A656QK03_9BURK|nr:MULTISPECIES: DUF922 domain-containing protein [Burkholderiaceae]KAK43931.1 hypothetical protein BG58_28410 [Caballeronia jiangsuensis]KDR28897.1 hypothetical protein BG60_09325 [Caballeronia zhejiangensis]KWU19215.1 hypothetical protein AS149_13300 [Burkholderia cenocepacia]SAL57568.1 hypothetical protein AWB71_03132 [Caballeronia peredens]
MNSVLRKVTSLGAAAIALSAVLGFASPHDEQVQVAFKMDYYDVAGETWPEVWSSIQAGLKREKDLQGRYEGLTSYSIKLEPEALVANNTCSSKTAAIAVNLVVKVPRLTTRNLKQGQECWAFYDRSLSDHEEWHVQIAIHDMQALQAKIRSSPNISCEEIVGMVKQDFQKMVDEQNDYDAITNHGLQQWRAYGLDKPKESDYDAEVRNRCFG